MESYKAAYHWTEEEFVRAMRHHYQTSMRPAFVWAVNITSLLLAGLAIWVLTIGGPSTSAYILIAFAIYWLILRRRVNCWLMTRGFGKRPDANGLTEWTFSADKVKQVSLGVGWSEREWKSFTSVVEVSDGFLFYTLKNLFNWLPFTAFEEERGVDKVREYLKENGVPYTVRKS